MSVTSNDLKSMLSRVRNSDGLAPASQKAKLPSQQPPAAPAAALAPAAVAAEPVPIEAEAAPALEAVEIGSTDIGTILSEIMGDEDLMTRILGVLYRAKKKSPNAGAVAIMPMERELGIERESATFVLNYMKTKHLIETDDKSRNIITVNGIDFLRERLTKIPVLLSE